MMDLIDKDFPPVLGQDEVRERCKLIDQQIAGAKRQVNKWQMQKQLLQELCSHPAEYDQVAMGEEFFVCPDCRRFREG